MLTATCETAGTSVARSARHIRARWTEHDRRQRFLAADRKFGELVLLLIGPRTPHDLVFQAVA